MSELQVALKNIGVLEAMEARARELGTTLEEALRLLVTGTESVSVKPKPGTVEFYDAVCARITGDANTSYLRLKEAAEKEAGRVLDVDYVLFYALSGHTNMSLATNGELDDMEEAIDYVLGQ